MVSFVQYPGRAMSYQDQNGGYPQPPNDGQSQYPPPPGSEEDDRRAYHQRGSSNGGVTLPSISAHEYSQYPPSAYPPDPRGYAPDPYGPPPAGQPYRDDRGYQGQPQDYGRSGGPNGGGQMAFSASAPRQRTAIACRYCRRRKIRCSGFEQNANGRCVNCERFQQECIFTPVSSQAQAFVPAHAVYPGMRNMGVDGRTRQMGYPQGAPQLYGAHGQPLGPVPPQQHAMGPAPLHHQSQPPYDYPAPSPTRSYSSYGGDEGGSMSQGPPDLSRKRPQQDPHHSILPPPLPGPAYSRADSAGRRLAADEDLRLPPVTPMGPSAGGSLSAANYSPGSSTSSHSNMQPGGLPILTRTPPPRSSPGETGRTDPMNLSNIMERRPDSQIDRSMLGRLDRPEKLERPEPSERSDRGPRY